MIQQAGILAAGLGTRLREQGGLLKPMVPVLGTPLIGHVVRTLSQAGVKRIALVLNGRGASVEEYCRGVFPEIDWKVRYRDTANSLQTFAALMDLLLPESFLLSTVDAVVLPAALQRFAIEAARRPEVAVLAVTNEGDDEKPLWVRFDEQGHVLCLGPSARGCGWVTAGVYRMKPEVFSILAQAGIEAFSALREFLTFLVERRASVGAIPIGHSVDVDRFTDVQHAERLLRKVEG